MVEALSIIGVCLVAFLLFFAWKFTSPKHSQTDAKPSSSLDAIPAPPTYDQKLGNIPELGKAGSLHEYLTLLHNEYGPMAGFRYFEHFVISLSSPELFKQTNKLFNRPVPLFALVRPLIGEGSIQYANDEDAKTRRKLLDPFFAHASVKNTFPVFIEATTKCTAQWDEQFESKAVIDINLKDDMFQISIYAIALSAFGSEMAPSDMTTLHESYTHCWNEMDKSIKGSPIEEGSPREAIFNQHRDSMFALVQKMLDNRKAIPETADGKVAKEIGGFVEFMLQQDSFSQEQIKSDTMTFLIGGFHTTANFLIWALYFLAKHPQIQDKAREEIVGVLHGKNPAFDDVVGLPYTTAVLNETLRIAAVGPFGARYSNEDEVINGINIPKGTMMVQALGVVLQSGQFWDSPDAFRPERFYSANGSSASEGAQWAFKPFGVGNRTCPASKYAMLEAKTVLSILLQNYTFSLLPGQKAPTEEYGLVGAMKEDMFLRVQRV